uniref:hypothetical protein n=1 Tax=Bradyrhizobium australafricanum TaxID=2821406 RepID=UPI0035DB9487
MLHARAMPDSPYDGHTLRDVLDCTETLTGCSIERAYVDKGYRGYDAQNPRRVFISGQKRGVFGVIKRELRRRSAIEPIIGHLKTEGHLGRCYLKGRAGDAANVILRKRVSEKQLGFSIDLIQSLAQIPSTATTCRSFPGRGRLCCSFRGFTFTPVRGPSRYRHPTSGITLLLKLPPKLLTRPLPEAHRASSHASKGARRCEGL